MPEPSSPIPDGPTEAEVEAAMTTLASEWSFEDRDDREVWIPEVELGRATHAALTAALAASYLREQVHKLTEENERLRRAVEEAQASARRYLPPSGGGRQLGVVVQMEAWIGLVAALHPEAERKEA
jgi:hypothetical protein